MRQTGKILWLRIFFSLHDYSMMIVFCAYLQIKKLRQQEGKLHAQGHLVSKWRIQDSFLGSLNMHQGLNHHTLERKCGLWEGVHPVDQVKGIPRACAAF